MKEPINCPKCGLPMINDFSKNRLGANIITKTCHKKPDHKIIWQSAPEGHWTNFLSFYDTPNMTNYIWYFGKQQLDISKPGAPIIKIPYFEPNFSDFKGLKEKLKLYLTFS